MKIELNKVTTFSKTLAGILFIAFPILAFWLGMEYQELKYRANGIFIENLEQAYKVIDYKNADYVVRGARVTLVNGAAVTAAIPGTENKTITSYFGNELRTDINNDAHEDIVFLLTQETGGSGTFYYVVAAINTHRGYIGSEALLLGDRIAPQSIEKGDGNIIIVNYTDRAPGEPFTTPPSVGKSLWLLLDLQTLRFGEVAQNFEGEANPATMTLQMKTWTWADAKAFTLTFSTNGRVAIGTDCNSMGGSYTTDGNKITFGDIASTLMYCEGSRESEFASLIQQAKTYHFTSREELILTLQNGGSVVLK